MNARDSWGRSPLDMYAEWSHPNAAAVLRDSGGKCFVQTGPLCGVDVAVGFSSSGSGTVSAEGGGGALSDGDEVRQGATVIFTATPAAGHYVSGWSGNCAEIGDVADGLDGTAKLCAVSADSALSVRAEFSEIPSLAGPLCPSGSLSANGQTQAQLDAGLVSAAKANDLTSACEYLRRGADVETREATPFYGGHRRTPLMIAANLGFVDFAGLLLGNGANVNRQVIQYSGTAGGGWSALHYASGAGHRDMAEYLLDQGADVGAKWSWGRSVLFEASFYAHWETVELLLSRGANVGDADAEGLTPLHAVGYGEGALFPSGELRRSAADGARVVALLLDAGADVNARGLTSGRKSPLDVAVSRHRLSQSATLRAAGGYCYVQTSSLCAYPPVVTAVTTAVTTAVMTAVTSETVCESGSLSANGQTQAQLDAGLISAAKANDLTSACEYLRRGASVEAQEQSGRYRRTALMIAAHGGYLDLAKLLHANGADVNSRVGNGGGGGTAGAGRWNTHADTRFTALMYAAGMGGDVEMVGWLLDNGADPNLGDSRGRFPLWEAAHYGRVEVMGLLLDGGADVDGADVWGVVPLQAAGPHYNYGRGPDDGHGPEWSYAATVAGYLLSRGADVNARDIWGRSPLDAYAEWSHPNAAAVLRNADGKCFVQTGPLCGEVQVAVGFSSSGSGTVSAEGDGESLSDGDEVRQGAMVMFTAAPAAGHYVSGWLGNCAEVGEVADGLDGTAKSCVAAADSALSVRAEFSEIPSLAGPLCPSGSLSANGLTQAELDAGLVSAAGDNGLAGVCEYLRRGASVEAQEQSGRYRRTALMIAAHGGYLDLAKLLHANGADVNSRVGNGGGGGTAGAGRWNTHADTRFTALMYAAGMGGDVEMVGWLLDNGADPNLGDSRGRFPLWEAAHYGRVEVMGLLLDGGADVDGADVWGIVPLQAAGPHYNYGRGPDDGHGPEWSYAATVAGYLLSRGADVNARDIWGRSPLDAYAEWSHPNAAAVLRNADGKCFVQTGPLCGEVQVAVGFSSSGSGTVSAEGDGESLSDGDEVRQGAMVMFTAAPAAGHYVSGWLGNCAEVGEVADGLDGTAKSCVAAADSALSVRAEFSEIPSLAGPLCPSGSLSANGLTQAELDAGLVSAAGDNGLAGVCEYLRRGASVEAQEQSGRYRRTALMIAAHGGYLDLAKLLHANGADVNSRVGNGGGGGTAGAGRWNTHADTRFTALMYAAGMGGDVEMVGWLLDNGADPNLGDSRGRFPLWEAAHYGRVEVMGLLLDGGADVDGADVWGVVPLQAAGPHYNYGRGPDDGHGPEWSYAATVAGYLLSRGADVNARDIWGRSPLDAYAEWSHPNAAAVLRNADGKCFVQTGPLCGEVQVAVGFSSSGSGTVSAEGGGGALSDGDEVRQGATVIFTATPAAGHYVSGWSGNCAEAGEVADGLDGTAKVCAAAADSDLSVRAEFSEIPSLAGPLCPSGSLSANGLTQAQLDAGLISAAQGNDLPGSCEYLRRGANVDARESGLYYKRTALMIAANDGFLDLAKLLHANGADVNLHGGSHDGGQYDRGWSALHYAAVAGNAEFARWLLDSGAEVDTVWAGENTALWEASYWGRPEVVELLLSRGADVLRSPRDLSGIRAAVRETTVNYPYTRTMLSYYYPKPSADSLLLVVSLLAAGGAELNERRRGGRTILDEAVNRNNARVAGVLRQFGGKCFLETGPLCGEVQVAVGFSSSGSGTVSAEGDGDALSDGGEVRQGATVVFTAAPAAGHYVSGWSGNCAEIGTVADGLDGTAKSCAVSADSALSVRAEFSEIPSLAGPLCPSGSLSANGLTQAELDAGLLSEAGANDSEGVCEYLRRGANIEARDRFLATDGLHRRTPLMLAAVDNRLELAKLLVGNGASVNYQSGGPDLEREDGAGWSALMYAAGAGQVETATYLLDQGAEIDMQWASGYSALHEAAIWGRYETVKLLIARGANVNLRDYALGGTPLHGASWGANSGHFTSTRPSSRVSWNKVIKALLDSGADVNARRDVDDRPPSYGGGASPLDSVVVANKSSRARKLRDAGGYCYVQISSLCAYPPVAVTVDFSSSGSGTVSAEGDGDALSDGGEVRQGATVMFTATPAAGHYVSGWSGNCADAGGVADGLDGTAKSCSVLADSDLSVRAEFSEIPSLAGPLCPSGSLSANGLTTAELNMTLRLAARGGDAARACEALRRGADVNDNLDNTEFTPLQEAVSGGHLDAVKLLLANGAEVNKRKDSAGRSPLDLAARDSEAEIAALLRDADGECFLETGPLCGSVPVATTDLVTVVNTVAATVASTVAATVAAGSCPAESLPANGMTQSELNMTLRLAARSGDAAGICEALRRGAEVNWSPRARRNRTALYHAAKGQFPEATRVLLANGAEVNSLDGHKYTPLHMAMYSQYSESDQESAGRNPLEVMRILLANGADARARNVRNITPLHLAFKPEMAELLISHGADVNARSGELADKSSPLDVVFRAGDEETAEVLRRAGGKCFVQTSPRCENASDAASAPVTVVATVASSTVVATVANTVAATVANTVAATVAATVVNTVAATIAADELSCLAGSLPSKGLSQNQLNIKLGWAVYDGMPAGDVCEWLRRGADANGKIYGYGYSHEMYLERDALHYPETVAQNLDNVSWTPLHEAADSSPDDPPLSSDNKLFAAKILIANGANVNSPGAHGILPMHVAAFSNMAGIVQLLIDHGADVNASDVYGWTPLHDAVMFDSLDAAKILISRGAKVNLHYQDWVEHGRGYHRSLLYEAAGSGSSDMVKLLVDHGANVNPRYENADGPLHRAAFRGGIQGVSILIAAGADVNTQGSNGRRTPVWIALKERNAPVLELMLANGGEVEEAMLEHARGRQYAEIIALLEAATVSATVASAPAPAPAQADQLRERFAGAFNPSPAFGDAFGATSGSSERFLGRLDSLMRSSAGSGSNVWDSFGGWERENEHGRMWFSTGQRGDFGFGAGGNGAGGDLSASPFAALVGNGMLAGGETGLGADGKLRIAAFADYQAKSLLDGEEKQWTQWAARGTAIETAMTEAERFSGLAENQTRGAMTELHLGGGDLGVALQAGAVSESDSVLSGTAGDESLRGLRSRTAFAGLSGAANLFGSGWRLRGSAHLGRSWAESEGMLLDSDLWASAFSAGLERGGWLYSDDGFVLRFSQPLRVENWDMELIGDDGAGRLGADASGRQLDVDAAYRLPLSGGGWLLLSAGVRRDGGHSSSSDLEAGALFSVERGF